MTRRAPVMSNDSPTCGRCARTEHLLQRLVGEVEGLRLLLLAGGGSNVTSVDLELLEALTRVTHGLSFSNADVIARAREDRALAGTLAKSRASSARRLGRRLAVLHRSGRTSPFILDRITRTADGWLWQITRRNVDGVVDSTLSTSNPLSAARASAEVGRNQ